MAWKDEGDGKQSNKKTKETKSRTKIRNDHVTAEKDKFANPEGKRKDCMSE